MYRWQQNDLKARIELMKEKLVSCDTDVVTEFQSCIRALRILLQWDKEQEHIIKQSLADIRAQEDVRGAYGTDSGYPQK